MAHPSPSDVANVSRSDLGLSLTLVAIVLVGTVYLLVGLRRSSRAETVRDFFFFDKQVSPSQYFDVTVGYSFQVAVTVYFVFWGYKYGIGVAYYALTWLLGIFLFQLSAPRLLEFALANETLHSFLAKRYGALTAMRRLTAFCTLFGLVGALLIEVNLTTDMFGKLSAEPISDFAWIAIFFGLVLFTWVYVQYGGYKAAVITDAFQLPISYTCVAVIFLYLSWSAFRLGFLFQALAVTIPKTSESFLAL